MFPLKSKRTRISPLTLEQIYALQTGRNHLDRLMGLSLSDFELNFEEGFMQEFDQALENYVIPGITGHAPEDFYWYTHWIIIDEATNLNIGGIGISGLPDDNGQVLLGYYIDGKFEGKGYMTEALAVFLKWVFLHRDVKLVVADTLKDGYGSQKVLQKNGFVLTGPSDEGLRWQKLR
jgi:ribosomal-protein-alanine N-acetyltransferase